MAILRIQQVLDETGKTRTRFYADVAVGLFPRPVSLGPRAVGWPDYEIQAIVKARIAGWTDDQVRSLVQRLHDQRLQDAPEMPA